MLQPKAAAVVAALLNYNLSSLRELCELLRQLDNKEIGVIELDKYCHENRGLLLFQALVTLDSITPIASLKERRGVVNTQAGDKLLNQLSFCFEAIGYAVRDKFTNSDTISEAELGWTLPLLLRNGIDEPRPESLEGLMKYTVSVATETLYLLSPFMDHTAAVNLSAVIGGAAQRGVQIYLITHNLDQKGSPNYSALEVYRRVAPQLKAFNAMPRDKVDNTYLLLHAKLFVADGYYAVLSSANVTQYGLKSHLEVGVGVKGTPAKQLKMLMDRLIQTDLVDEII